MTSPQAVWPLPAAASPASRALRPSLTQRRFFNFSSKAPILAVPLSAPPLTDLTCFPTPLDYVGDQPDLPVNAPRFRWPIPENPVRSCQSRGAPNHLTLSDLSTARSVSRLVGNGSKTSALPPPSRPPPLLPP